MKKLLCVLCSLLILVNCPLRAAAAECRYHAAEQTGRVALPVQTISQMPELPNGCEITAAAIVLNYLGYNVAKTTLADAYLPQTSSPENTDPELAYMGNPRSVSGGWYCFTAPVVTAINAYLRDNGAGNLSARDLTGAGTAQIKSLVAQGYPVLFWATTGFSSIKRGGITLPDGSSAYTNLHCMVCIGYTATSYLIADPLGLCTEVDAATFEAIYQGIGRRAVVVSE